jgi:hypothetical protein
VKESSRPQWQDGEFLWEQPEETADFVLCSFRKQAVANPWRNEHGAKLAGCKLDSHGRVFPKDFVYSPFQATLLDKGPQRHQSSIPPFAQQVGGRNRPGFPETEHPLVIQKLATPNRNDGLGVSPSLMLPLPDKGRHHFIVANFGLSNPVLLSLDIKSGNICCWIPHMSMWHEIAPRSDALIDSYCAPDTTWSMHAADPERTGVLYIPTDSGIARVDVNPLALTYEVSYLTSSRCISGLIAFGISVFGLALRGNTPCIEQATRLEGDSYKQESYELAGLPQAETLGNQYRPFATKREVYWLCNYGQIRLRRQATSSFVTSLIPWSVGTVPMFHLGGSYIHTDGSVWQQCLLNKDDEHFYAFVELGTLTPELRPMGGYRLTAAYSCVVGGQRITDRAPWEPVEGGTGNIRSITVPMLESLSDKGKTLVCMTAKYSGDPERFFADTTVMEVDYEFWGHRSVKNLRETFFHALYATPWDARLFIFGDHLYLYDPDSKNPVPGWQLAP